MGKKLRYHCSVVLATICLRIKLLNSGVNGSVTLGRWIDAKGSVSWGRKSRSEVQERRPNRGSSGRTPQADTYFGNVCKTDIFFGGKIENAYLSRCFLKITHAAVSSAVGIWGMVI